MLRRPSEHTVGVVAHVRNRSKGEFKKRSRALSWVWETKKLSLK